MILADGFDTIIHVRTPSPTGLYAVGVQIDAAIDDACGDNDFCQRDMRVALTGVAQKYAESMRGVVAAIIGEHSMKPYVCREMWKEAGACQTT